MSVPWPQTDQQHRLRVDLVEADGSPVLVPTGPGAASPFRAELGFHVGRPPGMQPGDAQTVSLAIGLQAMPFPALGSYQFTLYVDDEPVGELPYRLAAAG